MYLFSETTCQDEMTATPPDGPGFTQQEVEGAAKMEVWASSFADPGNDFCEFRLLDHLGHQIRCLRADGY